MSAPLRRIRLPQDAQAWAKKLDLVDWVGRPAWNTEPRFKVIDQVRTTWTTAGHVDLSDDPDSIVVSAFSYFAKDAEFTAYVLDDCGLDMTEDGAWRAANMAYAWVVLQRYNRELGGEV